MRLFKKEHKLDNCGECGAYGMMQRYEVKITGIIGFQYILCRECIKKLVSTTCQLEMRKTV